MRGRPCAPASSMFTVRPLTFGTSRGLTPAGSVVLPYGGSFSKGAIAVICIGAAADAIATPPSAEAPARNSRLESPGIAVPFMLPPWRPQMRPDVFRLSLHLSDEPFAVRVEKLHYGRERIVWA